MVCRMEEAKHEMESRLDSQRRHMVQKESLLQNEIEELKRLGPEPHYGSKPVCLMLVNTGRDNGTMEQSKSVLSQMSRIKSDIHTLMATERQHRQELEQAELEKRELLELVKGLQKGYPSTRDGNKKGTNVRPLVRLESMKRKPREVTVI